MQANYQLPSYTGINDNNVMMMEVDTSMVKLENVPNRNVAAKVPLLGRKYFDLKTKLLNSFFEHFIYLSVFYIL